MIAEQFSNVRNSTLPSKQDYNRAEKVFEEKIVEDPEGSQESIDRIYEDDENYPMIRDLESEKAEVIPEMELLISEAVELIKPVIEKLYPEIANDFTQDLFKIVDGETVEHREVEGRSSLRIELGAILKDKFDFDMLSEIGDLSICSATSYAEDGVVYVNFKDVRRSILEFQNQLKDPRFREYTPEQIREMKVQDISNMLSHEFIHLSAKPQEILDTTKRNAYADHIIANFIDQFIPLIVKDKEILEADVSSVLKEFFQKFYDDNNDLRPEYHIIIMGGRIQIRDQKNLQIIGTGYELNEEITELLNEKILREVSKISQDSDDYSIDYYISRIRDDRRRGAGQVRGKSTSSKNMIINPEEAELILEKISKGENLDYTVNGNNLMQVFLSGKLIDLLAKYDLSNYIR